MRESAKDSALAPHMRVAQADLPDEIIDGYRTWRQWKDSEGSRTGSEKGSERTRTGSEKGSERTRKAVK